MTPPTSAPLVTGHRRWLPLLLMGGAMAAAFLLYTFNPSTDILFPPCPFNEVTGYYCPGCGTLRALHALLHGHVMEALDFNALTVLFLPFVAYGLASEIRRFATGHTLPLPAPRGMANWSVFWVVLLFWGLRNIPFHPFSLLAPGS